MTNPVPISLSFKALANFVDSLFMIIRTKIESLHNVAKLKNIKILIKFLYLNFVALI